MSLAYKQTICLLSMVSGNMGTIEKVNSSPQSIPTVLYIKDISDQAIQSLTNNDLDMKSYNWCKSKIDAWDAYVVNLGDIHVSIVLAQMALNAIDNLILMIRDKHKLSLLIPIHEALKGLSDQIDPIGEYYEAYDEANATLVRFYSLIGYSPKYLSLKDIKGDNHVTYH